MYQKLRNHDNYFDSDRVVLRALAGLGLMRDFATELIDEEKDCWDSRNAPASGCRLDPVLTCPTPAPVRYWTYGLWTFRRVFVSVQCCQLQCLVGLGYPLSWGVPYIGLSRAANKSTSSLRLQVERNWNYQRSLIGRGNTKRDGENDNSAIP